MVVTERVVPNAKRENPLEKDRVEARKWLQNFYDGNDPDAERRYQMFDPGESLPFLREDGSNHDDDQSNLDPRNIKMFFEELISFVDAKGKNTKDREEVTSFLNRLHKSFFSFSPNITNRLNLEDVILVTAKANQVPEIQGWFGQDMVGEVAYEICWARNVSDKIAKAILKSETADILDAIHQLRTIAAACDTQPEDAAIHGRDQVMKVVEIIGENSSLPIVAYAVELALKRMKTESQSMGILRYTGDKGGGRFTEAFSETLQEQSDRIRNSIGSGAVLQPGMRYLPIARDGIAVLDHSNLPRFLIRTSVEALPTPQSFPLIHAEYAKEFLQHEDMSAHELLRILKFLSGNIPQQPWMTILGEREFLDAKDVPELRKELLASVEKLIVDSKDNYASVPIESYEQIEKDPELNPFATSEKDTFSLLLRHLHEPEMKQSIEEDLGIRLADIPVRSQIHFLRYLASQDRKSIDRIKNILSRYEKRSLILRSFLAVAQDKAYGNVILDLAEKADPALALKVFKKYVEIADASEQVRDYLFKNFGKKGDDRQINTIVQNLLNKANVLLKESLEREIVSEHLDQIKTEILMFAASFKIANEEQKVELAEVRGTLMTIKDSSEILPDEREEMLRIFRQNRPGYSTQLLEKTAGDFEQALQVPGKKFYILTNADSIVAFIRFDELANGNLYAGSLNVRPEVRGSAIGSAMLRATLEKEGETRDIEAVAYAQNPMLKHYTGDYGFQIIGEVPDYDGTGELFYKMLRPRPKALHVAA